MDDLAPPNNRTISFCTTRAAVTRDTHEQHAPAMIAWKSN